MRHLLATRHGRLLTFFLLYVTEGIPQGFASVAIAFQMRKQGLGPAEVGAFVASLYLPWAWKVIAGPIVDLIYSERLGKRRAWIVGCQLMMSLTLLLAWPIDYSTNLHLFSLIIVVLSIGVTMELWKAVQHPSGVFRGFLLPGLALQRLTTREPELADTRVALRAVASVLRREL